LGEGISGKVKKHLSSIGPVAVKKMFLYTPRHKEDCQAEINILRELGRLKGYRLFEEALPSKAYIVSEYYSGVTLTTLINARRFPVAECIRLMNLMVKEVAQLHDLGYIHNDIKPDNFMTHSRLSTRDEVKLVDFAFTRLKNDAIGSGTPEYAAPEFILNAKRPRTEATDIYSLGIVFHQMLGKTLNPPPELQQLADNMRAHQPRLRPDLQTIERELENIRHSSIAENFCI
jgi:serine/threonine protein kinase